MKSWRNVEGYADPTASRAFQNMEEQGMGLKDGEIYNVVRKDGVIAQNLIIRVFENYSLTLMLKDSPDRIAPENVIEVVSRSIMYADAGRLGYVFNNILEESEYIRTLGEAKLNLVKGKIVEMIVGPPGADVGPTEAHSPEIGTPVVDSSDESLCTDVHAICGVRIDATDEASNENRAGIAELVRMETERQMYKGLCERLLTIIEKGAVGK